ncbi:MAG: hypothetical protein CFH38_01041, partial [Alphaproteobacteria bacterium MarineAlpha10_Bin1]
MLSAEAAARARRAARIWSPTTA